VLAVGAVGIPIKAGDNNGAFNKISAVLIVMLFVLEIILVSNAASAFIALATSAVILAVFAAIAFVFVVIFALFVAMSPVFVVILDEFDIILLVFCIILD